MARQPWIGPLARMASPCAFRLPGPRWPGSRELVRSPGWRAPARSGCRGHDGPAAV